MAEELCRLFIKQPGRELILFDYDRVEDENILRQNFLPEDIGKFKSQVLADRLARKYGRRIAYSVMPFEHDALAKVHDNGMAQRFTDMNTVFLGCVDRPESRKEIAKSLHLQNWWIDAGNGRDFGQVLIGNTMDRSDLYGGFYEEDREVHKLPAPPLQLPALLVPITVPAAPRRNCAVAVQAEEQDPVINRFMACLMLTFVRKFLTGTLEWMGAYIDLGAGTLQTVPADPTKVAKMFGLKVDSLYQRGCHSGGYTPRIEEEEIEN